MLSKKLFILLFFVSLALVACLNTIPRPGTESTVNNSATNSNDSNSLTIWWNKGYYPEEDAAFQVLVRQWEQKTGHKAKLILVADSNIIQQVEKSFSKDLHPDIFYAHLSDLIWSPQLAWQGKLVDVSDVIEPVKNLYPPETLKAVNYYNNVAKKRSYYAVPIQQQTVHISYWRDLVKQANLGDIPKDWEGFWNYWKKVQDRLRENGEKNIYAFGFPMSPGASDTYFIFEQFLVANNIKLVDETGQLLLDNPQTRQTIIKLLNWFTSLYKEGYVPPAALSWQNTDNNVNFLNRSTILTPNPSLSIPVSVKQETDLYYEKIGTIGFPNQPDGKPVRYLSAVKQILIFESSKNQKLAKEFLAYLIQPENLGGYIKNSLGRQFPVMPELMKDPFWNNIKDPHLPIALKQFTEQPTHQFYTVSNSAYVKVQEENIWGKAMNRIITDGLSPEQATDEAFNRIKQIFAEWK